MFASRKTTGKPRRSGAWGIGWQVLLDGLEITQFTYFQQCGGIDLDPVSVELTYGLDRIAAYLRAWITSTTCAGRETARYGEVRLAEEQQFSAYSFDYADPAITRKLFDLHEKEAISAAGCLRACKARSQERAFRCSRPTTSA